jgi:hypothetical protein
MLASDPITAISNAITELLKVIKQKFFKTPEEKRQDLINQENERLDRNKQKSRKYLKKRFRLRR